MCPNPNLDNLGDNYHLLNDDKLPLGITLITHACSSLLLKQIWGQGIRVTRQRCVMLTCHRLITAAYKASREDADCNVYVCPNILARFILEGRLSAWYSIFSHTLVVESDYSDTSELALHCIPARCFKGITVKHVSPIRASSESYFNRDAWMEQNISLYKQFGLPVREDGGPTYLKCVCGRSAKNLLTTKSLC